MLIQSLAAPAAAIIGWLCLDEIYLIHQWTGMAIALSGVAIVIFERAKKTDPPAGQVSRKITPSGVGIGLLGMLGQAGGMVLSKVGMQTETGYLDAFSSTQIRAIAAFSCFVLFFTVTRRWQDVWTALADTKAVVFTAMGAGFGPFAGVSLSLLTLHYLTTGVASTFFALVPITIIPFSIFLHKERVSARAVTGAVIAVLGVSLLAI
jgi:drug/metabolite transporter (DMT)-like permease